MRLLALGALYREFCVRAFQEGAPGEWVYKLTEDLVGEHPLLDAFSLGQLAESRHVDGDHAPHAFEGVLSEVLRELVVQECENVIQALREQWGESEFFASMYEAYSHLPPKMETNNG